jgi:hypothetical protein
MAKAAIVSRMESSLTAEEVKRIVATVSDDEATGLAAWYAGISRAVASFPAADLKDVVPPLRSVPGPLAR